MNMAPLDTMINTFWGSWFDLNWKPQLSTPPVQQAVTLYANLLQNYGEPGASTTGWEECLGLMSQGKGAMFYDATSLAGVLETPSQSKVAGQIGYAYAPTVVTPNGSRWLWAWSLDIIKSSRNKDAAFQFLTWATSSQYLTLAGNTFGWASVPPGTYNIVFYGQTIIPYNKDPKNPQKPNVNLVLPTAAVSLVPYHGVQYVGIPQFESAGQQVSDLMSAIVAKKITISQALQQSDQILAAQVNKDNASGY